MANLVSFRSGDFHTDLEQRGSASLAAKFAAQRYLALMSLYRDRARAMLTDEQREFLYTEVLPRVNLESPEVTGMLYAYADKHGATENLVMRLYEIGKDDPILLDVLIDDYRLATQE